MKFIKKIGLGLILIGLLIVVYYFATQSNRNVLSRLGELMVLPDEVPTIMIVTDKSKLINQPVFKRANNGDQIFIFANAGIGVLYRPGVHKIVDVATIIQPQGVTPTNVIPTKTIDINKTIAIFNGSKIPGLTDVYEKILVEKMDNITITSKEKAVRSDFEKSIVVYFDPINKQTAQEVASIIGGEVADLPVDETKPATDLIIILGKSAIKN